MRSNDLNMPEEQNRLVADKLSDYLVTVSKNSTRNLLKEGNHKKNFQYGDVMFDSLIESKKKIERIRNLIVKKPYIFFTLHRNSNSNYKTISFLFKQMKLFKLSFFGHYIPKYIKL